MTPVRFFIDEDIHAHVAPGLRAEGFDVISTPEVHRIGQSDPSQLAWAIQEGRVLVTFNVGDFARLHHEVIGRGDRHAGLVVSQQRPIGDVVRRLLNLGRTLSADAMRDRLEYLGNWPPI